MEQVFANFTRHTRLPNNTETNNDCVMSLIDQTNFLNEENKTQNAIIQILLENFSKQLQKQEFIFNKKAWEEKTKRKKVGQLQTDFQFQLEKILPICQHPL